MEISQELAERVRALRLNRGWKQSTLAARSGVNLSSLRRFEQAGLISLSNLLKLAFALNRLDDFLRILNPPPAKSIAELAAKATQKGRERGSV